MPPALVDIEYVDGPVVLWVVLTRPDPNFLELRLYAICTAYSAFRKLADAPIRLATQASSFRHLHRLRS